MPRSVRPLSFGLVVVALGALGCQGPLSPQARALLLRGYQAYEKGDDGSAIADMDAFLADGANARRRDEAHYLRGLARYRSKDLDGARVDLLEAQRRTEHRELRAKASSALGDLAWDGNDVLGAEQMYRVTLENTEESEPTFGHASYRLGCVLQRQGRWNEADLQFSRVVYRLEGTVLAKRAGRRIHARTWTIQAGAYEAKASGDAAAAKLRAKNMAALVRAVQHDGRLLYVVLVGKYPTYERALAALPKVRAEHDDAFMTVAK